MNAKEYLDALGVTMSATMTENTAHSDSWKAGLTSWHVTVCRAGFIKVNYYSNSTPEIVDVIHALISDRNSSKDTFRDFCDELGFDTMHPADALETFELVQANARKVELLFTPAEIDELAELLADY